MEQKHVEILTDSELADRKQSISDKITEKNELIKKYEGRPDPVKQDLISDRMDLEKELKQVQDEIDTRIKYKGTRWAI